VTELSDAWLLVIDPQVIFADPSSEWAASGFDDALAVTAAIAPRFDGRVLVTRWLPDPAPKGSWAAYFERWPFAARPPTDPIFDLMPGARDLSRYPTVDCPTFSKWGLRLQSLTGPTPTLVLTGCSTDCCVLSTALGAADAGATVFVVADGCAASSAKNHAAGLALMSQYDPQIRIVDAAELVRKSSCHPGAGSVA